MAAKQSPKLQDKVRFLRCVHGRLAKWKGRGLQTLYHLFDSGICLKFLSDMGGILHFMALIPSFPTGYYIKGSYLCNRKPSNYMKVIVQTIQRSVSSDVEKAIKYYSVMFSLNNIRLPQKQLYLLAFTAARGSITSPAARKEFVEAFDSSLASLENMKQELVKAGLLVQIDMKYKVNPQIALDFTRDIVLKINLKGDEKESG